MLKQLRPYNLLGIAGLFLFAISFIVPNQNADIHFHDRFYGLDDKDGKWKMIFYRELSEWQ